MLHLVLIDLIAGADAMSDQKSNKARRHGAEKIVHALESYGTYFDTLALVSGCKRFGGRKSGSVALVE